MNAPTAGMKMPTPAAEGVCPLKTREVVDRVIKFGEIINKRTFYAYQLVFARRIVESLLLQDGDTLTALFCRQSGKTEVVGCIALALVLIMPSLAEAFPKDKRFMQFKDGMKIGIFAPSNKHSGIVYFRMRQRVEARYFTEYLDELGVGIAHSRGDSFAFTNNSTVEAHSASENVLNEGGTYHLIITDESQRLDSTKINKELRPMLSSKNGTMVQIGTALAARCQFKRDIDANLETERTSGKRNHFQFAYEQVIADRRAVYQRTGDPSHLGYEKWVQKELDRIGGNAEDESFRMNFRLLWQESFANALNMVHFEALGDTRVEMNQPWALPYSFKGGRIAAGIDVARDGDSTWVTVLHVDTANPMLEQTREQGFDGDSVVQNESGVYYNKTVIGWLKLQGNFEGDFGQYSKIVEFLGRFSGLEAVAVDATGMGDPVWERLSTLLPGVVVIPVRYSTPVKHNLFRWYFQEIAAGRFHYAAGPETKNDTDYKEFVRQHGALVRQYVGNYLHVYARDENDHDDAPNSAALAEFAAKHETGVPVVDFADDSGVEVSEGGSSSSNYRQRGSRQGRVARYASRR